MKEFRFIDLFAGCGGSRQGCRANGGKCVLASGCVISPIRGKSLHFVSTHFISLQKVLECEEKGE